MSTNTTTRLDAATPARRRRGRWISAGTVLATTSLVASLIPTRVAALAADLPAVLPEPSAWGLPVLAGTPGSNSLLELDRAGDTCQVGDSELCVVRTTTPEFGPGNVEPHPEHGWEYILYDLGAEQARGDASGPTTQERWSPGPGTMVDGGTYVVAVAPADPDGELAGAVDAGELDDPTEATVVVVDRRGDALQEWQHVGPFSVAPITGDLVMEATLNTSDVSVPLTLTYRTSNLTTPAVGPFRASVGGGWEIGLPAPPTWFGVVDYGATGTLELTGTNGQKLRFVSNGDGTYELPLMAGADAAGVRAVLTADDATGGWRLVDTDGAVYVFDYWGDLASYSPALSDEVGAATHETTWFGGSLTSVTDPVTGRRVELAYVGGPTSCAATPAGFDTAPLGSLCSIAFVDDPDTGDATARIDLGWRGDDIAALLLPEGRRLDFSYDLAGVLTTLRDPNAGLVSAISGAHDDVTFDMVYDGSGRISAITGPASAPGAGDRETLRFDYAADHTTVTSDLPGAAAQVATIAFDPDSWLTLRVTDPLGVASVALYDADDRPLGYREGDMQTVFERSDDGRTVTVFGPAPVSMFDPSTHLPLEAHRDQMPMTREVVDSTADSRGWVATWWDSAHRSAGTVGNTVESGPITAPAAVSGGWSAELVTTVARDTAVAGYLVTVDGAILEEVTVDGQPLDGTGLPVLDDAVDGSGPVIVTVLLSGESAPDAANPVTLQVTAVDGNGAPLSTLGDGDFVAPLQLPSERHTRDWATGAPALVSEVIRYDDPLSGRPTSVVTTYPDGTTETTTAAFEGFRADFSALWRAVAHTAPSGMTVGYDHWGARERATPPGYDTPQLQGGLPSAQHLPDNEGVTGTEQTWWTSRGRLAATVRNETGTVTSHRYDALGRHLATTVSAGIVPGTGGDGSPTSLEVDYGMTANGLFVTTHTSVSEATGTTTTVTYRDLHDRVHHLVDPHGVRTDTVFASGSIVDTTYLADGVSAQTTTTTFTADGTRPTGIVTVGIDGRTHRTDIGYDDDQPWRVATVVDSTGIDSVYGYDSYGRRDRLDVTDADGTTWSETATFTPDGRITSRVQTAGGAELARQQFSYDATGTAATFIHTGPDGTTEVATTYGELPAELAGSNPTAPADRTPSQIVTVGPDGRATTVTIGYDRWAAPSTVTRDGDALAIDSYVGAITRFDATKLSYDQQLDVTAIDDGTHRYEYRRDAVGDVLTTVTTIDGVQTTYHNTASGLTLGADHRPVAATLPSIGAISHTVSSAGSSAVAVVGLDGNVWADLDADAPRLSTATPTWFTPYGMPIGADGVSDAADGAAHQHGWKELPTTATVNPVVITPFRAMLPEIGSFTTPDPIAVGSTLYNYTNADPFNTEDLTGLSPSESRVFRNLSGITSIVLGVTSMFFPKKYLAFMFLDLALNAAMWGVMFATGDLDDASLIAAISISVASLLPLIPGGIRAARVAPRTMGIRPHAGSISSSVRPRTPSLATMRAAHTPSPPSVIASPPRSSAATTPASTPPPPRATTPTTSAAARPIAPPAPTSTNWTVKGGTWQWRPINNPSDGARTFRGAVHPMSRADAIRYNAWQQQRNQQMQVIWNNLRVGLLA